MLLRVDAVSHRVVIAGSSGLIGRALVRSLRARGHTVTRLIRGDSTKSGPDELPWDPLQRSVDRHALEGASVIVNLAGAGIADARWTPRRKRLLESSRIETTQFLSELAAALARKPDAFVSSSAVGYYGDRPWSELLDESSRPGNGFLAGLCVKWEEATHAVADAGVRTVLIRTGMVLSGEGGALPKMLPFFRKSLGGSVGSGSQAVSWIAVDDAVRAIEHIVDHPNLRGPVNLVAPNPVTNAEFADALAKALGKSARFGIPAAAVRMMFGRLADETLLAGQRVEPRKLLETGFSFLHPTLSGALAAILSSPTDPQS
jgi:uncharacterized protein (TIGR01777 family)